MRLLHTASSKLEVGNEPASSEITTVVRLQVVLCQDSMAMPNTAKGWLIFRPSHHAVFIHVLNA